MKTLSGLTIPAVFAKNIVSLSTILVANSCRKKSFADFVPRFKSVAVSCRTAAIVVASGNDGVGGKNSAAAAGQCGYNPVFPASSPYVIAVGATKVCLFFRILIIQQVLKLFDVLRRASKS